MSISKITYPPKTGVIRTGTPEVFDPTTLPDDFLLRTKQISDWTGLAIPTLEKWRLERRGPPWIRCETAIRYRVGDIRFWLKSVKSSTSDKSNLP